MTKEEIIQNNKMIAEFMGCRCELSYENKNTGYIIYSIKGKTVQLWRESGLKTGGYEESMLLEMARFHDCWEWIMPVVEKIESIYDDHHGFFGVFISGNSCTIQGTNINKAIAPDSAYGYVYYNNNVDENKFMATYKSVVDFIIWYKKSDKEAGGK